MVSVPSLNVFLFFYSFILPSVSIFYPIKIQLLCFLLVYVLTFIHFSCLFGGIELCPTVAIFFVLVRLLVREGNCPFFFGSVLYLAPLSNSNVHYTTKRLRPTELVGLHGIGGFVIDDFSDIFVPVLKLMFNNLS
jgi:hypothetical protein